MEKRDILHYLENAPYALLMREAMQTLHQHKGKHVNVRALIEFSNICRRNCLYCGLRQANRAVRRYRLGMDDVLANARDAARQGADTIVLQSGEGAVDAGWLAELIGELCWDPGLPVTLSVGECAERDYALWKKAGAKRFLIRHETSNPALYAKLHPGYTLEDRLSCLRVLKDLGYECGGGFMVGLPGQTMETIADDLLLCESLKLDMAGIGPFLAQGGTPLSSEKSGGLEIALRALAILRLLLPDANLPATTALASLDPERGQILGLNAGANVLMPNFTPDQYGKHYKIYDGKKRVCLNDALHDIEVAGRCHALAVS